MKIEGVQEFADKIGRAGQALDRFGKRTKSAGGGIMRAGLQLMVGAVLLLLVVALLFWLF